MPLERSKRELLQETPVSCVMKQKQRGNTSVAALCGVVIGGLLSATAAECPNHHGTYHPSVSALAAGFVELVFLGFVVRGREICRDWSDQWIFEPPSPLLGRVTGGLTGQLPARTMRSR